MNPQQLPEGSKQNSFVGVWKMRNGNIIHVKGYCATTIDGSLFSGWYGELGEMLMFWDDNGKHIRFKQFDLMTRGIESYGAMVFD